MSVLAPMSRKRRAAWLIPGLAAWGLLYGSLAPLTHWFTAGVLALPSEQPLGRTVEFLVFETPKVLMLLVLVTFVVGLLRTFVTPERTRRWLVGRREATGSILAALLGIVTPFCSCSAVPLFIGFVTAGVPLGVTFSFLVASPMINEVALVMLFGLFGWKVAALYAGTGLAVAILAGWVLGRLRLDAWVEPWVYQASQATTTAAATPDWSERLEAGVDSVRDVVGRVWVYVVLGITVGAGIHGYVPEGFMASLMGRSAWWAVPAAVILGVPMYSNAAGIIPIVQALLAKGAALGTVLAFMMAVIGLSLPEAVILRKVLTLRLLLTFFGIVALGIMAVGYLFNAVIG